MYDTFSGNNFGSVGPSRLILRCNFQIFSHYQWMPLHSVSGRTQANEFVGPGHIPVELWLLDQDPAVPGCVWFLYSRKTNVQILLRLL